MNIHDLELTIRSENALRNAGIDTVEKLVALDWKQLSDIKNAGSKSITEICWQCIQLLNGKLLKEATNWGNRYQFERDAYKERMEKIKKYNKIARIIQG